jgi:hypothetical protein
MSHDTPHRAPYALATTATGADVASSFPPFRRDVPLGDAIARAAEQRCHLRLLD